MSVKNSCPPCNTLNEAAAASTVHPVRVHASRAPPAAGIEVGARKVAAAAKLPDAILVAIVMHLPRVAAGVARHGGTSMQASKHEPHG